MLITVTEEGNALKEQCKDIPMKIASQGFALSEQEARELYGLLYRFLEG